MRGDLVCALADLQTDRSEPLPLSPQCISNWLHNLLNLVRRRRCCGIKINQTDVGTSIVVAKEQVAHTAAHKK